MALGLAIIFGQMGVINMAHGEFMTIGAYIIFLASHHGRSAAAPIVECPTSLPVAICAAFVFAFGAGWLAEWALIRHLYKRPARYAAGHLGPVARSCSRPSAPPSARKEVSPTLPDWLMGSWSPAPGLDIPINGLFVMALTRLCSGACLARAVPLALGAAACAPPR